MSATRRSALPESSAGIRPSQSKSRKVILTPISFAISSASSTALPVRSPAASTSEKGGPWVCTATRSSPRLAMSSSVPALAAAVRPNERKACDEKLGNLHWAFLLVVVLFHACCSTLRVLFERRRRCRRRPPLENFSQLPAHRLATPDAAPGQFVEEAAVRHMRSGLSRPGSVISRRASICATMLAG